MKNFVKNNPLAIFLVLLFSLPGAYAASAFFQYLIVNQYVSIGSNAPADASSALDISSTTKGFLGPRMTETQRDAISSPATGLQIFNTSTSKVNVYNGTSWTEVGGGGGASFVKWLTNPNGIVNTTGWNAYNDSAAVPVDGTGGTGGIPVGRTTVSTLYYENGAALVFNKPLLNQQGSGISTDFVISPGLATGSNKITVKIDYKIPSTDYVNSDVIVYVYDKDAARIQPCANDQNGGLLASVEWARFRCAFYTNSGSDDYRLIIHQATTNANATPIYFQVSYFSDDTSFEAPITTPWTSYTATGSWTSNTTYVGKYRRVGDSLEGEVSLRFSAAPSSGALTVNIPSGLAIDTTKLPDSGSRESIGSVEAYDASGANTGHLQGKVIYNNTTSVFPILGGDASGDVGYMESITPTAPVTWASGDVITVSYKVPIVGWSQGALLSTSELQSKGAKARYTTTAGQSIPNNSTTIVNFDTKTRDTLGNVATGASWKFTATVADTYRVDTKVSFPISASSTGSLFRLFIFKNGAQYSAIDARSPYITAGQNVTLKGGDEVEMLPGDYIDIRILQNDGGARGLETAAGWNYVNIKQTFDPMIFGQYGVTKVYSSIDTSNRVPSTPALGSWALIPSWTLSIPEAGEYDIGWKTQYDIRVNTQNGIVHVAVATSSTPGTGIVGRCSPGWVNATSSDNNNHRGFYCEKKGVVFTGPTTLYMHAMVQNASGAASISNFEFRNDLDFGEMMARKVK